MSPSLRKKKEVTKNHILREGVGMGEADEKFAMIEREIASHITHAELIKIGKGLMT
jgi:hypothetical protein